MGICHIGVRTTQCWIIMKVLIIWIYKVLVFIINVNSNIASHRIKESRNGLQVLMDLFIEAKLPGETC